MRNTRKTAIAAQVLLGAGLVMMTSCAPVNRFTRIRQVPREYMMNYCGGEIKAPRTVWLKNNPWIVFSDKSGNMSYQSATGKNEMRELQFLDAFLVIGQKGEWLRTIKYNPELLKGRRLQNRKQAEYYGWINKSDLLLSQNSVTDLSSGLKNKQITVLSDTASIKTPDLFFVNDSIQTFMDVDMAKPYSKIPFYQIVYPLKQSEDRKKTLLSKKSHVSPDSLATTICGWVDNSLLESIGQQLHVDLRSLPDSALWFKDRADKDTLIFRKAQLDESQELARAGKALSYSPVFSYCEKDTTIRFKTGAFMPVVDKRDNYVLNVNGNPIYYSRFKEIEKELQKINVLFVVEGGKEAIRQFPELVNVIQGLQPLFSNRNDGFHYKFGSVLTFNETGNHEEPVVGLTDDYMQVLDFLSEKSRNIEELRPVGNGSWNALRTAVSLLEKYKKESNLVILVGETGNGSEWADSTLVNRMAEYNCRILGFQLYGGEPDRFNNFVLQVENMIDNYAVKISRQKREIIVFADQLRKYHEYREVNKNVYCLDFPQRSMTQGWVVFPQKKENLPLDGLASSIDTLLQQVRDDNRLLTTSLYKAFAETGNFRNRPDTTLIAYHRTGTLSVKPIVKTLPTVSPKWYLPAQPVVLPDSLSALPEYRLLLSEAEFKQLRRFINALSKYEVDYKYEAVKKKKAKKRKICDCPEDAVLTAESMSAADTLREHKYASTRKVRANLQALYYLSINSGKLCKFKKKKIRNMSLADAQRLVTTCPTANPFLQAFTVKDLKKKKHLPDATLDLIVEHFKTKKAVLEEAARQSFISNGQTYYWIDKRMLP